jgi:hypothetical protein
MTAVEIIRAIEDSRPDETVKVPDFLMQSQGKKPVALPGGVGRAGRQYRCG